MKRNSAVPGMLVILALVFGLVANLSAAAYKDGVYFAQSADFEAGSGWKDQVTLEVKGGKITKAEWNGVNSEVAMFKVDYVKAGKYPMNGKQGDWNAQAVKCQDWLVKNQDPAKITYKDAAGLTDAGAGVSIHVKAFFTLAAQALAAGPVVRGPYKDGVYHADAEKESNGFKGTMDVLVKHGKIVNACWNGLAKDGSDKYAAIKAGKYDMKSKDAWNVQARSLTRYLIQTQDPTKIAYKDATGLTDAVAGVTIHVKEFFDLANVALKTAK